MLISRYALKASSRIKTLVSKIHIYFFNLSTVWSTWKVTILNIYCGYVFRVRDLPPFDLYYKFTSILFSGKKFWHIQFLNFTSFLWIFIEGGMVKLENWWQNFPFFIPYIKMDKNSYLEYHIKKFLSYLSKPQYWFKIVTLIEGKVLLF